MVTRTSWNDDKYTRELDLIDLASHARRTLTYDRHGLADPSWSADGTRLAFLADAGSGAEAKPQVFVMPMDGGDARPVTKAPEGVDQFAWRPDGGALAYAATDAEPKRKGADRFRDAFVVGNTPITTRKPPRPSHLFVVAASGEGKPKQLTSGPASVASGEAQSTLSWSPDGKTIAFTLAPNAVLNDADRAHAELVDVATGKLTRLTSHAGYEADPRFSPDGKHVAYNHSAGDNQISLTEAFVTTPAGGEGTALSRPYDRAVHDVAWLPDSSAIVFTAADRTAVALVRAPLGGGAPARLDLGDLNPSSPLDNAIARDGAMVFVATSTKAPAELYYRPASGGAPVKLTDYNAADRRARPRELRGGGVPDLARRAGRRACCSRRPASAPARSTRWCCDPRRPDQRLDALVRPARPAHGRARVAGARAQLPRQRQPRPTPTSARCGTTPTKGPARTSWPRSTRCARAGSSTSAGSSSAAGATAAS